MAEFIRVEQLCKRYDLSEPWLARMIYRRPKRHLDAVDDVSFSIERGKTFALVCWRQPPPWRSSAPSSGSVQPKMMC